MAVTYRRLFPRASVPVNLVNAVNHETYTHSFSGKSETPFLSALELRKQLEKSPSLILPHYPRKSLILRCLTYCEASTKPLSLRTKN